MRQRENDRADAHSQLIPDRKLVQDLTHRAQCVGLRRKCHVSLLDKIRQITLQNTESCRARQMSPVRLGDWATRVVLGET